MEKLKVLQINKLYYPTTGGIERVVRQIAEGLNEITDMQVLVCKEKGRTSIEKVNGVVVHRAGSLGVLFSVPISFSFFWYFRSLAKKQDIIQFHMPFPLGDIACLLSGYKGKVVVWWHSDIVRQEKLMVIYRPLMERFLKRADIIIVATRGHIEGSDYLLPYKNKCKVIPFGVDNAILDKADQWIKSRELNKINNKVRFLFVGRLVYYKGCKILLKAFKEVEGAELVIIGNGNMEDELKKMVYSFNLEESVSFLGNISDDELSKEFAKCDVFVLPSIEKTEAFGLVQIEAMSYGKPVINTKLPSGVPYVSLDGITGLTVRPNNEEELTKAMQWMIDNNEERCLMGERARKRVIDEYQNEKMIGRLYSLYKNIN
ncbi:glycosyltransferase [Anaerocolumna xylanovorans]|uniref:Rhamnosyl/mannosyltransferase n=1 Tax=Anaerocolumna xylanovorans DSM 12503 TaxID=1121345 RepID=A0A1M7Y4B5_9FIRM|nr:glycosyltransferase [Anaerocolumna xylanovorans]SHO47124.1 rhamnosyl/mannosyltransferase [Anaerocolumna xylanovorans DSM 12503]